MIFHRYFPIKFYSFFLFFSVRIMSMYIVHFVVVLQSIKHIYIYIYILKKLFGILLYTILYWNFHIKSENHYPPKQIFHLVKKSLVKDHLGKGLDPRGCRLESLKYHI